MNKSTQKALYAHLVATVKGNHSIPNFRVIDFNGKDVTGEVKEKSLENAIAAGETYMFVNEATGLWTRERGMKGDQLAECETLAKESKNEVTAPKQTQKMTNVPLDPVMAFLTTCYKKKPTELIMEELKWKFLVRSVLRSKNVLLVGPSGTGKTFTAQCIAKGLSGVNNIITKIVSEKELEDLQANENIMKLNIIEEITT